MCSLGGTDCFSQDMLRHYRAVGDTWAYCPTFPPAPRLSMEVSQGARASAWEYARTFFLPVTLVGVGGTGSRRFSEAPGDGETLTGSQCPVVAAGTPHVVGGIRDHATQRCVDTSRWGERAGSQSREPGGGAESTPDAQRLFRTLLPLGGGGQAGSAWRWHG